MSRLVLVLSVVAFLLAGCAKKRDTRAEDEQRMMRSLLEAAMQHADGGLTGDAPAETPAPHSGGREAGQ